MDRDGSLSVAFRRARGHDYRLRFEVNWVGNTLSTLRPHGFLPPTLCERFDGTPYTSPITGHVYPRSESRSTPISWAEAVAILRELEPQREKVLSDYTWVFQAMLEAALNEGRPP